MFVLRFADGEKLKPYEIVLPDTQKRVLFLSTVDAEQAQAQGPPTLTEDAPEAIWSALQKEWSKRFTPPTFSAVDEALLTMARDPNRPAGEQPIRRWADNIPLTTELLARLRDAPGSASAVERRRYEMTDDLMNATVAIFNRECSGAFAFVFDTFVFTELQTYGFDSPSVQRLLQKVPSNVNLLECEQLLFPVHVPSSSLRCGHWYAVQCHHTLGHVVALDSTRSSHPEAIRVVQIFIEGLHAKACAGRPACPFTDGFRAHSLCPPRSPAQPNDFDCGVFTLVTIWCCIQKVPLHEALTDELIESSGPEHRSFWRAQLTIWLMKGRL